MIRKIGISVFVVVVGAGLAAAWYAGLLAPLYADYPDRTPRQTRQPNLDVQVIAHRGDSNVAPENTLASFEAAMDVNVDFIEVDMRLSADGVPVVVHDRTVDRTTNGTGAVTSKTVDELRQLDAGSWYAPEFAGERIPLVQEVLDAALGRVCVYADIKANVNRRLVQMLKAFQDEAGEGCLIVSLQVFGDMSSMEGILTDEQLAFVEEKAASLRATYRSQARVFKRYWPEFPELVSWKAEKDIDGILQNFPNVVAITVTQSGIDPEFVRAAHDKGLLVFYRIPDVEEQRDFYGPSLYSRLVDVGVDAVFMAQFPRLREYVAERVAAVAD